MTTLSAKTSGTVTHIHFGESDSVAKGHLLVVLEDGAFCARGDAGLAKAKASYQLALMK